MIDTKKEQERDELHRAIWAIADELRGAVDGWDFKNYVLGTMFYRYISENLCNYINEGEKESGDTEFDYAKMSDDDAEEAREGLVQEKGFFILPSELFCNVCENAVNDENLNETLERVFRHIEDSAKGSESENSFVGLFDDFDVNSNKLGATVAKRNEKLVKLLVGVANMNLGDVKNHDIDAFGDAYEYLMTMYASNAGKSGGEFFTPADVSELLTRLGTIGKTEINKVYDPACGSGSLLLKTEKVLGKDAVRNGFYGQEINITTYNLCRINMFLHDIEFDKFDIACEDTLTAPQHWDDEPFELIVSNPPYSIKWPGDENPLLINDPRFAPAGVLAPKSKADLAFVMHSLSWLAANGTAAIVCFPGIMYRGGAEQKIRKYLVDNNFVDCIIQLPSNLFFGTSIATCIMVMKKNKTDNRMLFIDASNECVKVKNNNKLTAENIRRIVDVFANREEVKHFSHLASYDEVKENDYNLSVSTYVEQEDTREKIDIVKLNTEIEEIVLCQNNLHSDVRDIIKKLETCKMEKINDFWNARQSRFEYVRLGDVCTISGRIGFRGYTKQDQVEEGEGAISLSPSNIHEGELIFDNCTYISWDKYEESPEIMASVGDIVFGKTASVGKTALIRRLPEKATINPQLVLLKNILCDSNYLSYYLKTKEFQDKVNRIKGLGTIPTISQKDLANLTIPIPTMEVQREIVMILEQFTTLAQNLTDELIARRKQYEYYRDKLLTFKELS